VEVKVMHQAWSKAIVLQMKDLEVSTKAIFRIQRIFCRLVSTIYLQTGRAVENGKKFYGHRAGSLQHQNL
jgi:hypothetical protein